MQNVIIKKTELLKAIKENRSRHRREFEKALEDYHVSIVGILEDRLRDARDARDGKKVEHNIKLNIPQDQTKDYDRAIRMIEMDVRKVIELAEHDFQCLVQDDWQWKDQFSLSNSLLRSTAMGYQN